MKKFLTLFVAVAFIAVSFSACGGRGGRAEVVPGVYVRTEYVPAYSWAPAKYDNALRQAHEIQQSLAEADNIVNHIAGGIQELVGDYADVKDQSFAELFLTYKEFLKSQDIVIGLEVVMLDANTAQLSLKLISPEVLPEEAMEDLRLFESMVKAIPHLPTELIEASTSSIELAQTLRSCVESLPTDFTGMNVAKIPAATAALTEAATLVSGVPAQVTTLTASLNDLYEALKTAFFVVMD